MIETNTDQPEKDATMPSFEAILAEAGLPMPDAPQLLTTSAAHERAYQQERAAWNAARAKAGEPELPYHDDTLTSADAGRIKRGVRIIGYFGPHGLLPPDTSTPLDRKRLQKFEAVPTQQEYGDIDELVANLEPNSVLVTEKYGFGRQPDWPYELSDGEADELRTSLEARRQDSSITLWEYAEGLARLRGVRVVHADQDMFDRARFRAILGIDPDTLMHMQGQDVVYRMLALRVHEERDRAARNIVKDLALSMLPDGDDSPESDEDKPTIAILYGGHHKTSIVGKFRAIGMDIATQDLREVSMSERMDEHLRRLGDLALLDEIVGPDPAQARPIRPRTQLATAYGSRLGGRPWGRGFRGSHERTQRPKPDNDNR